MFENLTERLNTIFTQLGRRGKLSEKDVENAMREVRLALLDADVNYTVVKDFIQRVQARAVGQEVSKALNPSQQVIKIVHEELIATLGSPAPLNLTGPKPRAIMLVGLQGSGKTTSAAKLARLLRQRGERVMLVAADPYRPAAITQLQTLGNQLDIPVYTEEGAKPPVCARHAKEKSEKGGFSVVLLDTAGRSQLDNALMEELSAIEKAIQPVEILLVVDAMIGQEAVNIAKGFRDVIPLTGLLLTKLDGDARGGAAISIRSVAGVPIKFIGNGEGLDTLETFDPSRLASRILGMGDILGLIERAEAAVDQEKAQQQAQRIMQGEFTLEDLAEQLKQIRRMGPFSKILEMFPGGMGQIARTLDPRDAEKQLKVTEAILNSMTKEERRNPKILNASRKRRIAKGSGTQVQDINRLLKQYLEISRLMKTVKKSGLRNLPRIFG
jgi:signal recognition particle subunit SRP54